jgi:hypothetical protein
MASHARVRWPTLADRLLAVNPRETFFPKAFSRNMDTLRIAKKFVLDAQAATYLGEMIRDNPRIIADAQDFAIRPFDHMWVELPFPSFYQAVAGRPTDATGDTHVGYLFNGPDVYVAAASKASGGVKESFLPFRYTLHRPMSVEDELRVSQKIGVSRLGLDLWFWGESSEEFIGQTPIHDTVAESLKEMNEWGKAGLRALRDNHSVDVIKAEVPGHDHAYRTVYDGSGGDLRNIVALLLFLNRTADIQYQRDVPMAQGLINRKPRPMMPHRVITLKLDPKPRLKVLCAGSGIQRRLHDVRGHFCHDKKARAGCPHGSQDMGDWGEWWEEYEPLRWTCTHCGGKRWWRKDCQRGRQEVGVIKEQTYAVTK